MTINCWASANCKNKPRHCHHCKRNMGLLDYFDQKDKQTGRSMFDNPRPNDFYTTSEAITGGWNK